MISKRLTLLCFFAASFFAAPAFAQGALDEQSLSDHPALRQGKYEEAREDWLLALEADPASPLAYCAAVCIARMNGQIHETLMSSERIQALAERVSDARASKVLRVSALSALQEKRFSDTTLQPPVDAFPSHVKHFAVLGALGPYDRVATLRHAPSLDVETLRPLPDSQISQEVEWHAVQRPPLAWLVRPEEHIYPRGVGEGWVVALIKAQPGQARIRIETVDAFQAWWNGERALNELRTSWADLGYEVDVAAEIQEGWNALLIRFAGGAAPDIGVQVLDSDGRAIEHESFDFQAPGLDWNQLPQIAKNSGRPLTKIPFEIDSHLDPENPWSAALASAMDGYGMRSDRALSREIPEDDNPAAAAFWRARHIAVREAVHLPSEVYRRLQLEAEAALKRIDVLYPEIAQARIERGMNEELITEAVREARELVQQFPDCGNLRYLEVAALDALDPSGTMGHKLLEKILEERPNDAWGWTRKAERALNSRDVHSGLMAQRRVIELDGERTETLQSLIERLSLGTDAQRAEAKVLLNRASQTSGHQDWLDSLRLTLLEHEGRIDEIDAFFEQRFEEAPWDYERLWDWIQWRLERPETKRSAIPLMQQYIARHPRAEFIRDSLARMGVRDEAEEFFEAFRGDRDAALALRDQAPTDASTAFLIDSGLVYFHADGGAHTRFHQLEVALDRTGTEQLHEHSKAAYTRVARVITTDGQIFEPIEVEGSWVMPSLNGGDVVEFEWDAYAQGAEGEAPTMGFYFASFEKPYMHSRLAVYVPEGLPGDFKAFQLAQNNVSWEKVAWKNGTVHLFTAKDQSRREPERGMPTPQELLPWVQYGEHETEENAIALWHEQFAQNSTVAADLESQLRSSLAELDLASQPTDSAKAEAIWNMVHNRILDWSEDGDTTDVWTLRRGDPLGLIGALLRLAEVPFEWGILHPPTRPELNPTPAEDFVTLGDWELPMIRLAPGEEGGSPTYISTLVRGMKFGNLIEAYDGATAWILNDSGEGEVRKEKIEFDTSSRFGTLVDVRLVVQENGDAKVSGVLGNTLSLGSVVRTSFRQAEPNQRDQWARGALPSFLDGLDLESSEFVDLEQPGASFRVRFEGLLPGFAADPAGARPRLPMFRLAESLGGADRDWPFVTRANDMNLEQMRVSIEFPEGYEFEYAPETQEVQRAGFRAGFEVEKTGSKLVLTRRMSLVGTRIEPSEFPEFLSEMKLLDEAIDTRVEITARPGDSMGDAAEEAGAEVEDE